MENSGLVSVVIPVYNSEKFLKNSIDSILEQTYDDLEIIAVDDGSTDNSLKILQEYHDKISIISQSNQGLSSALNAAIKKIKGKWFKWFSPDDILYPHAIEKLVSEATKLDKVSIIYSNWDIIDENNKLLRSFSESNYNHLNNFEYNVRLLDGQQINVNTTLIPTSLFEKGCNISNLQDPVAIDYDFFLRAGIFFNVNFFLIEQPLIKYRISKNQLSHKNITTTLSYLDEIRDQIFSQLEENKKAEYKKALKNYQKKKPISKKTLEFGLKLASNTLPSEVTDQLLVFYLNKLRRTR